MADKSVEPGESPFNLSVPISAVYRQDAAFWALYAQWREAEDAFECSPFYGDEPEGEVLARHATDLRAAMFLAPIATATALSAKLEALEECAAAEVEVSPGLTIFDVIRRDCSELANHEATKTLD